MIEICCGSYMDAMAAWQSGAKQIELNSALHLGGLTPSVSSLRLIKDETNLKVICMVRMRGAGFCYEELEFKQMFLEAKELLEHGADGIAFGFLNSDYSIDIPHTKAMIDLIAGYNKEIVFHRAFDCTNDPIGAIHQLIDLGVTRILTSGLQEKAVDGKEFLSNIQEIYGDRIQILAGSGLNGDNAKDFIDQTSIKRIHSSCKDWKKDPTTIGTSVHYSYGPQGHESDYDYVSSKLVKKIVCYDEE